MGKLIALICFLLVLLVTFYSTYTTGYIDTRTSAVCDGNVCQDFLFTCKDGEIIDSQAISGLVIFDEDWKDTRANKEKC